MRWWGSGGASGYQHQRWLLTVQWWPTVADGGRRCRRWPTVAISVTSTCTHLFGQCLDGQFNGLRATPSRAATILVEVVVVVKVVEVFVGTLRLAIASSPGPGTNT